MADELEDPREVAWHPRLASRVVGHDSAYTRFVTAFDTGRPHHAWLLTGASGSGKATLAYRCARYALARGDKVGLAERWIASRSHPDLTVLERSFTDSKPRKLKSEIGVDDARKFSDFFGKTSGSGGWRIGIIDCADDLNAEAANALLKLIEEPPSKCLFLLVCHSPGKLLRTLRSRCLQLPVEPLTPEQTLHVLESLPLDPPAGAEKLRMAADLSGGRPGHALDLINSAGARAFQRFLDARQVSAALCVEIGSLFNNRSTAGDDFRTFMGLLLAWIVTQARESLPGPKAQALALLHAELMRENSIATAYNLDRRVSVTQALARLQDALKVA